jgi:hypothetical protein
MSVTQSTARGPEPRRLASYKPEADSYGPETETYKSEVAAKPKIAGGVDQKPAYMIFLQQAALKRDPGRERAFRLSGYRLAARKARQLEK